MIWLRTLFLVALWAVAALLAHWLIGDPAGWIVFSVAMVAMLLWRSWRLHLVSHWAHHPDTSPPASVGPWDDIRRRCTATPAPAPVNWPRPATPCRACWPRPRPCPTAP